MTTNIYVLRLEGGRYYVGKSADPMQRYEEHLSGRGSVWTRKYRPIGVDRIIAKASPFDEDKITKEYMARYGIEKVRGGSYVSIELDDIQQESLQRELWAASDCCTTCGRKGHFASACFASTDVIGNILEYEDTKYDLKPRGGAGASSSAQTCYRCGRKGHYASSCYARTTVSGKLLDDSDDEYDESDYEDDY